MKMKQKLVGFLCAILPMLVAAQEIDKVSAMTFNIRYASPNDGVNIWENRKDWLCELINFSEPDVLGAQEVIKKQLDDMVERLPGYEYFGVGRNGGEEGEFCPIFYNKSKLEKLDGATFWLSETPAEVNSKGWDASLPRIVTWVKLKSKENGKHFYFFNTHFDHRGEKARVESAKLLREQINSIAGDSPFLVSGDFNFTPSAEAYQVLLHDSSVDLKVMDTKNVANKVYGPEYTFNGFKLEPNKERERIDYMFTGNGVSVEKHHVIDGQRGRTYVSDHFPIVVIVSLR